MAIGSAVSQTWPRIEVIIVDDGSKDGTLAVAKAWESRSVKVVTQQNSGAAAARNAALAHAQGQYIQWLDADDLLHPDKISAQMKAAHEVSDPRILMSCPFGTFYYRQEKAVFVENSLWRDLSPAEYFLARFSDNACFQTDAWLVSRELTDAAGPWAGFRDDDGEYFCRVVLQSSGVKFVRDAKTYYRVGNELSLDNTRTSAALATLYVAKVKCIEHALSLEDSARMRAACIQLLQDWVASFYYEREDLVCEAQRLASELGGALRRPVLKSKYRPVEQLFGYKAAFKVSRFLPRLRTRASRKVDALLHRMSWSKHRHPSDVFADRADAIDSVS
jgi:glycosyltransferase involved in cell wall biosynthesis